MFGALKSGKLLKASQARKILREELASRAGG